MLKTFPRCRATSGRSVVFPLGNTGYAFVKAGTLLANRTIVLLLLLSAKNIRWLLEQPANSCFPDLPRWRWLLSRVTATGMQFCRAAERERERERESERECNL